MTSPPIQAVIFDWAGTTVDYGSRAPARVFIEIFRRRGVDITEPEARAPMGLSKREHLAAIAAMPRVAALWRDRYARQPNDADVQVMYDEFLPLQKETLANHSDVIPGVPEAVADCRRRGIKIASTTGYTRELLQVVAPLAARGGYCPDAAVCSDEVSAGRPAPWMNFRAAELLGVYPMASVLVVDDTPIGIAAGLNAAAITVAVTQTGNALGLAPEQVAALPSSELQKRLAVIDQQFREAGAHHLLRSVAELPDLLDQLDTN
jgi:phosphonoacetaldehyde hydrolase